MNSDRRPWLLLCRRPRIKGRFVKAEELADYLAANPGVRVAFTPCNKRCTGGSSCQLRCVASRQSDKSNQLGIVELACCRSWHDQRCRSPSMAPASCWGCARRAGRRSRPPTLTPATPRPWRCRRRRTTRTWCPPSATSPARPRHRPPPPEDFSTAACAQQLRFFRWVRGAANGTTQQDNACTDMQSQRRYSGLHVRRRLPPPAARRPRLQTASGAAGELLTLMGLVHNFCCMRCDDIIIRQQTQSSVPPGSINLIGTSLPIECNGDDGTSDDGTLLFGWPYSSRFRRSGVCANLRLDHKPCLTVVLTCMPLYNLQIGEEGTHQLHPYPRCPVWNRTGMPN